MEVQKHLFRIAEKANKAPNADIVWTVIGIVSGMLGAVFGVIFLVGEMTMKDEKILTQCFNEHSFMLQQHSLGIVFSKNTKQMRQALSKEVPIQSQGGKSSCKIYKNINTSRLEELSSSMIFTSSFAVLKLSEVNRMDLNIANFTIHLENHPSIATRIYGLFNLLAIQLIQSYKQNATLIQQNEGKVLYIKSPNILAYEDKSMKTMSQKKSLMEKLWTLAEIVGVYAATCIVTSLYIYITIIASPALILIILKCTPYGRTDHYFQAFKAFPWIGINALILRSSNSPKVKAGYITICTAMIMYFILMYLVYYISILMLAELFFDLSMEGGIAELLFGYIAIVEFASLIFMRTRPFIKYFPLFNSINVILFLLYCKVSPYGFKMFGMLTLEFVGISIFSWMMVKVQIPAQTRWNNINSCTPSLNQPRTALFPVFNLSWISGLPEEWSILIPLEAHKRFDENELSLAHENFDHLNQYLNGLPQEI